MYSEAVDTLLAYFHFGKFNFANVSSTIMSPTNSGQNLWQIIFLQKTCDDNKIIKSDQLIE